MPKRKWKYFKKNTYFEECDMTVVRCTLYGPNMETTLYDIIRHCCDSEDGSHTLTSMSHKRIMSSIRNESKRCKSCHAKDRGKTLVQQRWNKVVKETKPKEKKKKPPKEKKPSIPMPNWPVPRSV